MCMLDIAKEPFQNLFDAHSIRSLAEGITLAHRCECDSMSTKEAHT